MINFSALPFESLDGNTFGICNPEDEGITLLNIQFLDVFKSIPQEVKEAMAREIVTYVMRNVGENREWSYPNPDNFKVGLID